LGECNSPLQKHKDTYFENYFGSLSLILYFCAEIQTAQKCAENKRHIEKIAICVILVLIFSTNSRKTTSRIVSETPFRTAWNGLLEVVGVET